MMNVSFQGLKGLSEPENSKTIRNMGREMKENFTEPALDAFQRIHGASGSKDVFIKIREERPIVTTGQYKTYIISVNDKPEKGKKIAETTILYTPASTGGSIYTECSRALSSLADTFEINNISNTASDNIEKMINYYA